MREERFVIYDTNTGRIKREVSGPSGTIKQQSLGDDEAIKKLGPADPDGFAGKRVDPETLEFGADPEFDPGPDRDALMEQYRAATTISAKLDILFELITGEPP